MAINNGPSEGDELGPGSGKMEQRRYIPEMARS